MGKQIIAIGNGAGNIVEDWLNKKKDNSVPIIYIDSHELSLELHNLENAVRLHFSSKKDLKKIFFDKGTRVIIVCCLGGRTGNEYFIELLHILNKFEIPNESIVTLPFFFEGGRKRSEAESILKEAKLLSKEICVSDCEEYDMSSLFSEINNKTIEILDMVVKGGYDLNCYHDI